MPATGLVRLARTTSDGSTQRVMLRASTSKRDGLTLRYRSPLLRMFRKWLASGGQSGTWAARGQVDEKRPNHALEEFRRVATRMKERRLLIQVILAGQDKLHARSLDTWATSGEPAIQVISSIERPNQNGATFVPSGGQSPCASTTAGIACCRSTRGARCRPDRSTFHKAR